MYIYKETRTHTHIFIWYTSIHALYNVIKTIIQCRPYTDHIWHTDHIFTFRLPRRLPWRAKESDATSRRTWTTAPPVWILRMPVAWLGRVGTLGSLGKTMEKPWKSRGKARSDTWSTTWWFSMIFPYRSVCKRVFFGEYWMILGWCHEFVKNGWVKFHVDRIGLERGGKRRWIQWETIEHGGCSASPFQD